MPGRSYFSDLARTLPAGALAITTWASAQMVPLQDQRQTYTYATYQGISDTHTNTPGAPFSNWEDSNAATAEKYEPCPEPPPDQCFVGSCWATAYQNSQFFPAGIQFTGATGAGWGVPPGDAQWSFLSSAAFLFRVDNTFDYDFFADVDQGDWPTVGGTLGGGVRLSAGGLAGPSIHNFTSGPIQVQGRLGPGTYYIEGWASGGGPWESFQGAAYGGQWLVHAVAQPIITTQPPDVTVGPGGTIICPIQTYGPQPTYAYQWRKSLVPLTDNGHIMGTATGTLRIINAIAADAGDYDVVVTGPNPMGGGSVSEPSRLAHVTILTTTGVNVDPANPVPPATVRAPAPNPFRASTSVRYEVSRPTRLIAAVYNASGARIRSLADRTVSEAGSVTWDGRLRSGARAPAGIYFVRVEVDGVREARKIVLLQ